MDSDLNIDRSRTFREGGGRMGFEMAGYVHAYGWSLPASSVKALGASSGSELGHPSSGPANISAILGGTSSYMPSSESVTQGEGGVSFNKLSGLQVPIPQYCRPLTGDSLGMKIWCATAVDLSGGDTPAVQRAEAVATSTPVRDPESSGSVVNITSTPTKPNNQQALRMLEQEVDQALNGSLTEGGLRSSTSLHSRMSATDLVQSALPISDDSEELSTCVWICSTQHSRSKITIIDIKTKPNEKLDSFYVSTFLYCIKSIPGSKQSDLLGIASQQKCKDEPETFSLTLGMLNELIASQKKNFYRLVEVDIEAEQKLRSARKESTPKKSVSQPSRLEMSFEQEVQQVQSKPTTKDDDAEISRILDNNVSDGVATLQKLNDFVAHIQPQADETSPPVSPQEVEESRDVVYYQPISTYLPTVWMGGKDSVLYIHSAIGQWKDCVACLKLRDSILQICHFRGRVFVALADGSLCVFFRNVESKQWELSQYLIMDIGLMTDATTDSMDLSDVSLSDHRSQNLSQTDNEEMDKNATSKIEPSPSDSQPESPARKTANNSQLRSRSKVAGIRCLEIANKNLWVGYKNRVLIIDPITLKLKHTFNVVPQIDNQIRQLIAMKDGVFCCLRSDLVLRLYSSLKPYQHIQNIDIEPVVTRLISPKTFVISHITAMKIAGNTLWIGNAHGIIITIPCKLVPQVSEASAAERQEEYEESPTSLSIARSVPKCDISNAQISFHGHKDAVKFFIHAHNLMLSGGQGYLDFRLDMDDQSKSMGDRSHLILWQLPN